MSLKVYVMGHYGLNFDHAYSHWNRLTDAGDGFMDQPHRFAVAFTW